MFNVFCILGKEKGIAFFEIRQKGGINENFDKCFFGCIILFYSLF